LLKSGSITRGQGATGAHFDDDLLEQPQFASGFPHVLQAGFLQPHVGIEDPHLLQGRALENPSDPPTRTRRPSIEPLLYMKPATPREANSIATNPINAI
jgi:hypothetical protein